MEADEQLNPRVGLLGELAVEMQIVKHGWHPVRLDTAQMASNADLLAINHRHRISIQVKTTNAEKQSPASLWLSFGYANNYLRDRKSVFNSKESPLIADVVVAVSFHRDRTRFVVMPIAFAESLCRRHCDYWCTVPTKASKNRSLSFPIYLPFTATRHVHEKHFERMKRNVSKFEDAWDVLFEDVAALHNPKRWPLLR